MIKIQITVFTEWVELLHHHKVKKKKKNETKHIVSEPL